MDTRLLYFIQWYQGDGKTQMRGEDGHFTTYDMKEMFVEVSKALLEDRPFVLYVAECMLDRM